MRRAGTMGERVVPAWAGCVAAALVLAAGAVVTGGYLLPVAHVASREVAIARDPHDVFGTIADVERYPEWRPGVSRVEVLARTPRLRWKETGRDGQLTFEFERLEPPARALARIVDRSLPFGGTWTYEVFADGHGSRVRITEHGEVYNPVFRVMSRYVFGHHATIDSYLTALAGAMAKGPPVRLRTGVLR